MGRAKRKMSGFIRIVRFTLQARLFVVSGLLPNLGDSRVRGNRCFGGKNDSWKRFVFSWRVMPLCLDCALCLAQYVGTSARFVRHLSNLQEACMGWV